jgi:hypothetical protein
MAKIKTSKMMVPVMKDEYTDKMSLNPYDQLFIKRMFDREDEYIAEIMSEFTVKVGLVIEEKLQPVMDKLDEITKRLDNHEKRLQVIEGRLGIAS